MTIGVSLLVAALVLAPGYALALVARRATPYDRPGSQLEFLLATVLAGIAVQALFLPLTAWLWSEGLGSETTWATRPVLWAAAAVGIVASQLIVAVALALGWRTARARLVAKSRGPNAPGALSRTALSLTNIDPPHAWDQMIDDLHRRGGWIIAKFKGSDTPVVGRFGQGARGSLSPTWPPDLLLDEVWWADPLGNPVAPMEPARPLWINLEATEYIQVIPENA